MKLSDMPRSRKRLGVAFTCLIGLVVVTACGSGSPGASTANSPSNTSPTTNSATIATTEPTATPPTTTPPVTTSTASGVASDDVGDRVQVNVSVGQPEPASQVTEAAVQACTSSLSNDSSSLARSAAVPVTVTTTVTSSDAVSVLTDLSSLSSLSHGNEQSLGSSEEFNGHALLWATTFSDTGAECNPPEDWDLGTWAVGSDTQDAGRTNTWKSYLVIPEAITPDAGPLTSLDNPVNTLLFNAEVGVATNRGTAMPFTTGSGRVTCGSNPAALAVNVAAAESQGCSAG